jgi:hypothetical protein
MKTFITPLTFLASALFAMSTPLRIAAVNETGITLANRTAVSARHATYTIATEITATTIGNAINTAGAVDLKQRMSPIQKRQEDVKPPIGLWRMCCWPCGSEGEMCCCTYDPYTQNCSSTGCEFGPEPPFFPVLTMFVRQD